MLLHKLDSRNMNELLRQFLEDAGDLFEGATDGPKWHYAGKFDPSEIESLLSKPLDDSGLLLYLVFARLYEISLSRLNKLPEKNFYKFLETMGVDLQIPTPASVPVTFLLKPGSKVVRVPARTKIGNKPDENGLSSIFETVEEFFAVSTNIASVYVVDPTWDRFTRLIPEDNSQAEEYHPFVGRENLNHELLVGGKEILDINFPSELEVNIGLENGSLKDLLKYVSWQYGLNGKTQLNSISTSGARFEINENFNLDEINKTGIKSPLLSRWVNAKLNVPIQDARELQDLRINKLELNVKSNGIPPQQAFFNDTPVDLSKDFFPFGDMPRAGDTFYISSKEAFSKPNVKATINFDIKPSPPPEIVLEYWTGRKWSRVERSAIKIDNEIVSHTFTGDGTLSFTQNGKITVRKPGRIRHRRDREDQGQWFRIRIIGGSFKGTPEIKSFRMVTKSKPNSFYKTSLLSRASKGVKTITVVDENYASKGAILKIGAAAKEEFVQVVNIDNKVLTIRPGLRNTHNAKAIVENYGLSNSVASTVVASKKDAKSVQVGSSDEISKGDILMIDDPDPGKREFVRVSSIGFEWKTVEPISITPTSPTGINPMFMTLSHITMPTYTFTDRYYYYPFVLGETINLKEKLLFDHEPNVSLRLVKDNHYLIGYADGQRINFDEDSSKKSFYPFGLSPGPGDLFYLITTTTFPPQFDIDVKLDMQSPNVRIDWEYFKDDKWVKFPKKNVSDETDDFVEIGNKLLELPEITCDPTTVNDNLNYWIRGRITSGNYGVPLDFEQIDPDEPAEGFKVKSGTGGVNPPVINNLWINYEAVDKNPVVVAGNAFYSEKVLDEKNNVFKPFKHINEIESKVYSQTDNSLYIGFDEIHKEQPITFYVSVSPAGFSGRFMKKGIKDLGDNENIYRIEWQYFNGEKWTSLKVNEKTENLTRSGTVEFLVPSDFSLHEKFESETLYWIRASFIGNQPECVSKITGIYMNTTSATQSSNVVNELIGSGNGMPGQVFTLTSKPVLLGQRIEIRESEMPPDNELNELNQIWDESPVREAPGEGTKGKDEFWVRWDEVPNFLTSGPNSRHYVLNHLSGNVMFGDGIRGMIPPTGSNNILSTYSFGGGSLGNLDKNKVDHLRSTVNGLSGVVNPVAADGGCDEGNLDLVKKRGPQLLRHRGRAVSNTDLEWIVKEAAGTRVARCKALSNINKEFNFEPGTTTIIIVPKGKNKKLNPSPELIAKIEDYLGSKTFSGVHNSNFSKLNIMGPGYVKVSVELEVVPKDVKKSEEVKTLIYESIENYLHPLTGGQEGTGWVFGRDVFVSEIYRAVERVRGVDFCKNIRIKPNVLQLRTLFKNSFISNNNYPKGSVVVGSGRKKAVLLTERLEANMHYGEISLAGFREGDSVTKIQDIKVNSSNNGVVSAETFDGSGSKGFPTGSKIINTNFHIETEILKAIHRDEKFSEIEIINRVFTAQTNKSDILTLQHPVSLKINNVGYEDSGKPFIDVEHYIEEISIDIGDTIGSCDNLVRLPVNEVVNIGKGFKRIVLENFNENDVVSIFDPNNRYEINSLEISGVGEIKDRVYIDDNYLVYSGDTEITITQG